MKDRASGRANLVATDASVELPVGNLVEAIFQPALLAFRRAVKAGTEDFIQVGIIVRILTMEHIRRVFLDFDVDLFGSQVQTLTLIPV